MNHYTVETTRARVTLTASSPEAAMTVVQATERCPRSAILKVSATRLYFMEITHYEHPKRCTYYLNEEDAAAAFDDAVDEIEFYGAVAQIRQGQQQGKSRTITRRHTNI